MTCYCGIKHVVQACFSLHMEQWLVTIMLHNLVRSTNLDFPR